MFTNRTTTILIAAVLFFFLCPPFSIGCKYYVPPGEKYDICGCINYLWNAGVGQYDYILFPAPTVSCMTIITISAALIETGTTKFTAAVTFFRLGLGLGLGFGLGLGLGLG